MSDECTNASTPGAAASCGGLPVEAPRTSPTVIEIEDHCKFIRADSKLPASATFFSGGEVIRAGDGGCVELKVKNPKAGTTYSWTELSNNIKLVDANREPLAANPPPTGTKVIVRAQDLPGEAKVEVRDSEGNRGEAILEVVRITFSGCRSPSGTACPAVPANANPVYGFDDCTTPNPPFLPPLAPRPPSNTIPPLPEDLRHPHISIESNKETHVHVKIEGNAKGPDFDFIDKDTVFNIVGSPPSSDDFVLTLKAKPNLEKEGAFLRVCCKGYGGNSVKHTCYKDKDKEFARLGVHVYAMKEVKVVVAKVYDPRYSSVAPLPGTAAVAPGSATDSYLNYPTDDYVAFAPDANKILRGAVVKYDFENYQGSANPIPLEFADPNGFFVYTPGFNGTQPELRSGGAALNQLKQVIQAPGRKRVAIIRKMKTAYYLAEAASPPTPASPPPQKIEIKAHPRDIRLNESMTIGPETVVFTSAVESTKKIPGTDQKINPGGATVTLQNPLLNPYPANAEILYGAAGWSTDPILVTEGTSPVDHVRGTVLHEIGHTDLKLSDIVDAIPTSDATIIMHYQRGRKNERLRYCPRPLRRKHSRDPSIKEENQWETIPRSSGDPTA